MILWYSLSHTSAVETCPPFSLSSQKVTLSRSPPRNILFISSKKNSFWSWQTSWLSNILLQNNKVDKSRSVCLTYMTLHFDRQKAANEVKMRNLMFCTKTAVKDVKCKFWEENWTRGRFTKCMFTSQMGGCGWDKLSQRHGCSNSSHCDTETRWSSKAELKIILLHLVRSRMCWSWTCSSVFTQFSIRLRPQPLHAIIIISSKSSACISLSAKYYVF